MKPGMMPICIPQGLMTPGQLGADEARSRGREHRLHAHHVRHRHAFGDAHRQLDARIDGFQNRIRGGRPPARRSMLAVAPVARSASRTVVEYRQPQVLLSAAARSHAAHELGAVGERCFPE